MVHIENQILIERLHAGRNQISDLVCELGGERNCTGAIEKISSLKGVLNSIMIRIIYRQLEESLAFIQGNPSVELSEERLNHLVDLFLILSKTQVYYQPNIDKVEHE